MANKNKIRWALYKLLKKDDVIRSRKGGYSLDQLISFIESYYGIDLSVIIQDWRLVNYFRYERIQLEIQRIRKVCEAV